MHPYYWRLSEEIRRKAILSDRKAGMGWGTLAKKYHMNKSHIRRMVLKLLKLVDIDDIIH